MTLAEETSLATGIDSSKIGELAADAASNVRSRPTVFRIDDLSVTYSGSLALSGVTIDVHENAVTAFIGPSGCGKSTFIRCLNRMNDLIPGAQIGGGLRIDHTSALVIAREAVIGSDVTIHHGVTIGGSGRRWFDPDYQDGAPVIGDETEIWAGAKVVGPIQVGRGCYVGANAVLAHDLADGTAYTVGSQQRALKARVEALEARGAPRPSDVPD